MRKSIIFFILLFTFIFTPCVFAYDKTQEVLIDTYKTDSNGMIHICDLSDYSAIRVVQTVPGGYVTNQTEMIIDSENQGPFVFTNYKFINPVTGRNLLFIGVILFTFVLLILKKKKKQVVLLVPITLFGFCYTYVYAYYLSPILDADDSACLPIRVSDSNNKPLKDVTLTVYGNLVSDTSNPDSSTIPGPVSFSTDSWETIIKAVREDNTDVYHVGDTKEIYLEDFGNQAVRIINKSTPDECFENHMSQSGCGFVLEFVYLFPSEKMYEIGGSGIPGILWPDTDLRAYANNTIYNSIPSPLKEAITDTDVVSSAYYYGRYDDSLFHHSTDKLFVLSQCEIKTCTASSTDAETTRILDYYSTITSWCKGSYQNPNNEYSYWTRTVYNERQSSFVVIYDETCASGSIIGKSNNSKAWVPLAFRIG